MTDGLIFLIWWLIVSLSVGLGMQRRILLHIRMSD